MRILLIQAPLGRREPLIFPLGLAFLAGNLKNVKVKVYDPNISYFFQYPKVDEIIAHFEPDWIAVSLRNIDSQMERDLFYYYLHFKKFIKKLRQLSENSKIVVGGTGFSLFARQIMEQVPEIDYGVYLEGEKTLPQLIESNGENPDNIKGLFFRKNGEIIFTGPPQFFNFKDIEPPNWEIFELDYYKKFQGSIGIQTKRGCMLQCAYCTYPKLNGRMMRIRNTDEVLNEIEFLVKEKGVRDLVFVDAVFNLPMEQSQEIIEGILERGLKIRWSAWFHENHLNKDYVEKAIKSGCYEFSFSPDATCNSALKALKKDITLNDIKFVLKMVEDIPDMKISMSFFANPPSNTFNGFIRLLKWFIWLKIIKRKQNKGFIIGSPRIEPDTEMYNIALKEGIIDKNVNLLPDSVEDLKKLFYHNPDTPYATFFFNTYIKLWQIKNKLWRN